MKVLLDNNLHVWLTRAFPDHEVWHERDKGWSALSNGKLLAEAESNGFDFFITADKNLVRQQNLSNREICVVILNLKSLNWSCISVLIPKLEEILSLKPKSGTIIIVDPPLT